MLKIPKKFAAVLPVLTSELEKVFLLVEDEAVGVAELCASTARPMIFYNPKTPPALLAFGLAHEYGHFLNRDHLTRATLTMAQEARANLFAREMLHDLISRQVYEVQGDAVSKAGC